MRKNYKYFKYIAFVLSLVMIMCSMSMVSYATYEDETIVEVEALREENVKHFKLPDGTYTAMVYDSAVHRKDENGEWQDIDNRMTEKNANNKQAYITSDGRTVFSKKINSTDNTVFEMNENGYTIKVHFDEEEIKNTTAKLSNHAEKYVPDGRDDIETQYKKLKTLNTSTTVEYKNILKGVNLEYVISSNDIKENIIVNKPREEYAYSFIYELKGLSAVLTESNSIELRDTDSEEAIYVIPTPYMYDSAGEISYDVAYSIIQLETGKYKLTVTANEEWINDTNREFPVVIDPTVRPYASVMETYISAVYPNNNFVSPSELWVSTYDITLMKFSTMPNIPDNATITYATLDIFYYYHISTGALDIGVYPMVTNWNQNTITWNSANQLSNMGMSTSRVAIGTASASSSYTESTPGQLSFNVTELIRSWYAGINNYGVALKREGGTNNSVIIRPYSAPVGKRPLYVITYNIDTTLPVTTGTYFFKNVEYDKYMQLDDSASNLNNDGIKTELWDFDGGTDQKWNIEYVHNGYYKITSAASGKALSTSEANSNTANASLEQYTYEMLERQQWTITNVNGMFKLSPRNNSYYMAAGSGIGSGNGRNVEQRSAQSDNKDEWILRMHEDYTLMYIGEVLGDPVMPPIVSAVETDLQNIAYMNGTGYTNLTKSEALVCLSSASIFSCITHGYSDSIITADGKLTIDDINQLDSSAFQNLRFVCLGACLTGHLGSAGSNLVNALYNKGADTVLGFRVNVNIVETNLWMEAFMSALAIGITVNQAADIADEAVDDAGFLNPTTCAGNRYIAGSDQIRPCT